MCGVFVELCIGGGNSGEQERQLWGDGIGVVCIGEDSGERGVGECDICSYLPLLTSGTVQVY